MEPAKPAPCSQVFLVRIWAQAEAGDAPAWRGKLQPLLSGEAYCFADWAALVDLLGRLAGRPAGADGPPEEPTVG